MMKRTNKKLVSGVLVLSMFASMTLLSGCSKGEEKYPDGNINVIVSAKAGGDTDTYARILAQYLEKDLGVTITVTNKDSAIEGTRAVYNAEADGYTVEFFHASSLLTKAVGKTDIGGLDQKICTIPVVDTTQTLVVPAKKFKSVEDFITRAQGGEEIVASVNQGSYAHLGCALLEKQIMQNLNM